MRASIASITTVRDRLYVASADWMTRNLSRRVEVAIPSTTARSNDSSSARSSSSWPTIRRRAIIDAEGTNAYARANGAAPMRAQEAFREYLASLH
jgi:polyphosphate kinase